MLSGADSPLLVLRGQRAEWEEFPPSPPPAQLLLSGAPQRSLCPGPAQEGPCCCRGRRTLHTHTPLVALPVCVCPLLSLDRQTDHGNWLMQLWRLKFPHRWCCPPFLGLSELRSADICELSLQACLFGPTAGRGPAGVPGVLHRILPEWIIHTPSLRPGWTGRGSLRRELPTALPRVWCVVGAGCTLSESAGALIARGHSSDIQAHDPLKFTSQHVFPSSVSL